MSHRSSRLIIWSILALAGFAALAIIPEWFRVVVPPRAFRKVMLGLLDSMATWYPIAVVFAGVTTLGLTGLITARRTLFRYRTLATRLLLLLVATLLGLGGVEATLGMLAARREVAAKAPVGYFLPEVYAEPSDPDELRVVVLGESSAEGLHYERWLSVGSIVAGELQALRPEKRVVHEKVANRGDTLEWQLEKLARLRRRPDLIIVYCGHNELSARFSSLREVAHYVDTLSRSAPAGPLGWVSRRSKVVALIHSAADRLRVPDLPPPGPHRPLVDVPNCNEDEIADRVARYRADLESLADHATRLGVALVILVPPSNDAGFEPSRSVLPAATSQVERERFATAFESAEAFELADPAQALAAYRALANRYPTFAETRFRIGRLLAARGEIEEAAAHFSAARDHDGLPIRARTSFQDTCREVARAHGLPLVDGQQLLATASSTGLLDDHLFHDAMHPALRGHVLLAQGVLDALAGSGIPIWPAEVPPPRLDPAAVGRAAGMQERDWAFLCERSAMFAEGVASLRYDPEVRRQRSRMLARAAQRIENGTPADELGLPGIGFAEAGMGPRH